MTFPEQFGLDVDPPAPILALRDRLGAEWPWILASGDKSVAVMNRLNTELRPLISHDTTMVVYGSLARHEYTDESDVDWTLLVDGPANPEHQDRADRIRLRIDGIGLRQPAPGGAFGNLTFSHDLIHKIGGDDDTNRNTTQRLLLLLESAPVGSAAAYRQVVQGVLQRYVGEDIVSAGDSAFHVPRFLQNDVVRYWRTMAVDFAHKRRMRGPAGWALRNAKLRLSRKLMYAAGLLSCFYCDEVFRTRTRGHPLYEAQQVEDYLARLVRTRPLDIVAGVILDYFGVLSGPGRRLFDVYDEFLGLLHDETRRNHLKTLLADDAEHDAEYQRVRDMGMRFQDALTEIFFMCDTPLRELTIRYGVF